MSQTDLIKILLIEDSEADEYIIRHQLEKAKLPFSMERVETMEALGNHLQNNIVDVVLSDFRLPRFSGIAALQFIRTHYGSLPFVLISGALGDEMAADMIKKGANDFLLKDRINRLDGVIQKVIQDREMIRDKEEKEELLQLISYIISHDLRAPVNNANTLMELMEMEDLPSSARQVSGKLKKSILTLKQTLDDLVQLTLSGYDAQQHAEAFALDDLIEEIREDLSSLIMDKKAQLRGAGLDLKLFTHRAFLKSIFTNLISNAIKYSHEDRLPVVEVKATEKDEMKVVLQVRDNGQGMDQQQQEVFKPFKRLASREHGYGMGLYITKKQVERLNGTIALQSKKGEGTVTEVTIPLELDK